jgi:hypothetical protein
VDTSFKTPSDAPGELLRIWTRTDGTVVLAGFFNQPITGFPKSRLMVLKPDGSLAYETTWGKEISDESWDRTTILASEWDTAGNLLIGGEFGLTRLQPVANFSRPTLNGQREFSALLGLVPNRTYRIEASTDFVNWTTLTNVSSATETIPFTDGEATNLPRRFYRAIAP